MWNYEIFLLSLTKELGVLSVDDGTVQPGLLRTPCSLRFFSRLGLLLSAQRNSLTDEVLIFFIAQQSAAITLSIYPSHTALSSLTALTANSPQLFINKRRNRYATTRTTSTVAFAIKLTRTFASLSWQFTTLLLIFLRLLHLAFRPVFSNAIIVLVVVVAVVADVIFCWYYCNHLNALNVRRQPAQQQYLQHLPQLNSKDCLRRA